MKVSNHHFFLIVLFWSRLFDGFGHLGFWFCRFYLKVNLQFSYKSFWYSHNIFRNCELLISHKLTKLYNWIWLVTDWLPLKFGSQYDINYIFKLFIFLENRLIFFEWNLLKLLQSFFPFQILTVFIQFALWNNLPNHIFSQSMVDATSQRCLNILSRHWKNFTLSLCYESIGSFTSFY